jgi:hypothetical protein
VGDSLQEESARVATQIVNCAASQSALVFLEREWCISTNETENWQRKQQDNTKYSTTSIEWIEKKRMIQRVFRFIFVF